MPEIRYYTVTQTRELKVAANNVVQAINLADAVFNGREVSVEAGINVLKPVRVFAMDVQEDNRGR